MSFIGGINLGNLTDYLLFFSNGSVGANWKGNTNGFLGNVAVNGLTASLTTSGNIPYAGTISTNNTSLNAWQSIITQNPTQSSEVTSATTLINTLTSNLVSAIQQINSLPASPGYSSVSSSSLNGLNTQNGINEVFVINITSGLNVPNPINITGDAGDVYILRWDSDGNLSNGYQGVVNIHSGGAIVPHGGLTPTNFINVCGNINSSSGGSTPPPPYPQGPRYNNGQGSLIIGGQDFNDGGFFTGYWLTTGAPTNFDPVSGLYYGDTRTLNDGNFVGGWYSLTTRFSMTPRTSGVYITPNPATTQTIADISIKKGSGQTMVIAGTTLVYVMTISNAGPSVAQNVILSDTVPACLLNPQYSLDGANYNTWTGSVSVGSLAVNATTLVYIRGQVNQLCTGTIVNTAIVSSPTTDTVPGNNTSTLTLPISTFADLSVVKGVSSQVIAGTTLVYVMTVSNSGPSIARSVTFIDTVPACLLSPQYSLDGSTYNPWTGSVSLGTLSVSATTIVYIRGQLNPSCTGTIVNTALVGSLTPDTITTNNSSTLTLPINTFADISVIKGVM